MQTAAAVQRGKGRASSPSKMPDWTVAFCSVVWLQFLLSAGLTTASAHAGEPRQLPACLLLFILRRLSQLSHSVVFLVLSWITVKVPALDTLISRCSASLHCHKLTNCSCGDQIIQKNREGTHSKPARWGLKERLSHQIDQHNAGLRTSLQRTRLSTRPQQNLYHHLTLSHHHTLSLPHPLTLSHHHTLPLSHNLNSPIITLSPYHTLLSYHTLSSYNGARWSDLPTTEKGFSGRDAWASPDKTKFWHPSRLRRGASLTGSSVAANPERETLNPEHDDTQINAGQTLTRTDKVVRLHPG